MAKSQYEHRDKKSMIKEESCASLVSMTSSRSISSIDIAFETIRIIRLNIDRNQSTAFSLSLHQRNKLRVKIKRETSEEKYLSNWYNKICYILISQEQFAREFSDHFSLPLPPSRIKIHYSS